VDDATHPQHEHQQAPDGALPGAVGDLPVGVLGCDRQQDDQRDGADAVDRR
jgi:hypothetical protein